MRAGQRSKGGRAECDAGDARKLGWGQVFTHSHQMDAHVLSAAYCCGLTCRPYERTADDIARLRHYLATHVPFFRRYSQEVLTEVWRVLGCGQVWVQGVQGEMQRR